MTASTFADIDRQIDAEYERFQSIVEAETERHRLMLAALSTIRGVMMRDSAEDDREGWISTGVLAQQWRVPKCTVHKRLSRSRLVEQPIPSREVHGQKYVLRSYIAPIIARWCPHEDMAMSTQGQGQAGSYPADSTQALPPG